MSDSFNWQRDKWKDIEDLINRWERRFPQDYKDNMEYIKDVKAGLKDKKFAKMGGVKNPKTVTSNHGTRLGLALHPNLLNYIETFYPDFMSKNSDVQEFGKRFKRYAIPEKF